MRNHGITRRGFLQTTAAGTAAMALGAPTIVSAAASETAKPAILGGSPVRKKAFPSWPRIGKGDDEAWKSVFHSRRWNRGSRINEFEKTFAELMGVKECLATTNGTNALFTSLNALGIGPGDEVLVPPYTFVATVNVVLLQYAIPVFVDTDRETFQIDAKKLEERITDRTRCMIPVHLGGSSADLDAILSVARKHKLHVIEDACQAHNAEWRGKKVGSYGDTGCFSFQATKNLTCGEGGAVITNDEAVMDRCFSFHTNGRERKGARSFSYGKNGTNARMTEFQATLLLRGMTRLEEQCKTRERNAGYLTTQLNEIPGIHPAKMYEGTTRNAYHLYMFRYDKEKFAGLSKSRFSAALRAEGIPCSNGYSPLNKEPFLEAALHSRGFQAIYSRAYIDRYFKNNHCPENDRLCNEEALWLFQAMFLGTRTDMDHIAAAIRKTRAGAGAIKNA